MKFISKKDDSLILQLEHHEFNAFRELIFAAMVFCFTEERLIKSTGWSQDKLNELATLLRYIAEESNIAL